MSIRLNIQNFLKESSSLPVIDVRSPSEFRRGHIPGAINVPLFTDSERKIVGTLYKKRGRKTAIRRGFEILAKKYTILTAEAISKSKNEHLMIYCWRGGMRSSAVAWLLERMDIKTLILEGGYKSYRRLVRDFFCSDLNLHIIGGMTGTGKTEILQEFRKKGHQVIDLEAIAHHKGSAFGSLGNVEQPTTEQFENDLLIEFLKYDISKLIWLENESQSIGRVFIPPELFSQMRNSRLFNIIIPEKIRIFRLVNEYSRFSDKELNECMRKIQKKIGGQNLQEAESALINRDYHKFAGIALKYYDKSYEFGLEKKKSGNIINIHSETGDSSKNAELIDKFIT